MTPSGFTHDRRTARSSDEWYTPPSVFDALGLRFDLDPAAPPGGVPWVPATHHFSVQDDGLVQPWQGRVWMNPPYGRGTGRWLRKLAGHGDGLALVFARTDTRWFQRIAGEATALCFVSGRLRFHRSDGTPGNPALVDDSAERLLVSPNCFDFRLLRRWHALSVQQIEVHFPPLARLSLGGKRHGDEQQRLGKPS